MHAPTPRFLAPNTTRSTSPNSKPPNPPSVRSNATPKGSEFLPKPIRNLPDTKIGGRVSVYVRQKVFGNSQGVNYINDHLGNKANKKRPKFASRKKEKELRDEKGCFG